jgi:hypothetical protein
MSRGFYSVVQYCPDRFRAEVVNVGLVLLCLEPHTVRVKMIARYGRAIKLFGIGGDDLKNLKLATKRLKNRLESANGELRTDEHLAAFAASRANDLRLTEPRLAKIEDIDDDFKRLFSELVEEERTTTRVAGEAPAEVLPPKLREVFHRLEAQKKIWNPGTITVPVSNREFEVPYAYRNGVVNLVKPVVFSATRRAESQAETLAVTGDLFRKRATQQLIVVSTQETPERAEEINGHVVPLFEVYQVRLVRPDDVDAFAIEVEQSAH